CFQLGARRLGFDARDCLVFEDAPAGIAAAEAAGASVMVINATHQHALQTPHAAISAYDMVGLTVDEQGWLALEPQRSAAESGRTSYGEIRRPASGAYRHSLKVAGH
ncbi:HAD-IA family hydrolase, partial [Mesorhizobium sp. M4B.F.Ca.ET.150.01.1.1]|uniref:HAD-IA family hydrolase n=1 Tax=Mesorhizobium sp. M4B.F.Ca.ET.150.01.1.1 TaxID=2563948 RepID=UPI00113FC3A0